LVGVIWDEEYEKGEPERKTKNEKRKGKIKIKG
jgi:hypothetical protein